MTTRRSACHPLCHYPHWWLAHDHPSVPLAPGAWLCDCAPCMTSLRTAATRELAPALVLKTDLDRILVTAEYAVAALDLTGGLRSLCFLPQDVLHQVLVSDSRPPYGARWFSAALARRVGTRAAARVDAVRAEASPVTPAVGQNNPPMPPLPARRSARRSRLRTSA